MKAPPRLAAAALVPMVALGLAGTAFAYPAAQPHSTSPAVFGEARAGSGMLRATAAPRDAATGRATGRRQHEPIRADAGSDTSATAHAPRDAASGLATGRRQHQPVRAEEGSGRDPASADGGSTPSPRGAP
ncbi:hypothetical protein [Sphingomonas colocasiae]|uniref:hypothetical protein n=1 Tax=Sphingomonas colocasiae TaxID=1848973 RepID=UPI001FE7ACF4|nr:hypothetical protein [Sphingomonas colocasiae]